MHGPPLCAPKQLYPDPIDDYLDSFSLFRSEQWIAAFYVNFTMGNEEVDEPGRLVHS